MHEPDKAPNTTLINDKQFTVQWMANIGLFAGTALSLLGAILSLVSGMRFYLVSFVTIIFCVVTAQLASKVPAERARSTAALGIVINIILFIVIAILFIFVKEAAQAI